jgi:predicted MFS family arabinose efflux permease
MSGYDKDFRRNFSLGVINGSLFNASLAFLSGSTILPVFISQLTDSRILIGLFSTMDSFGWFFPQLFAAIFIAHRSKVLGFYNNLSYLRLGFFGAAIAGVFIFGLNSRSILISFALFYGSLSIAAGFAAVAFTEIVAKTIPVNRLGSYFGLRMFIGGSLAALEGFAVKRVIASYPFPSNFGYLYIAAWLLMLLGLLTFAKIREPETQEMLEKAKPSEQLKSALSIFKRDANFRQLFLSRAAINTYYLSSPFYVVFAITKLGASQSIAGVYLTVQMIGYIVSNILWAWLSNHVSNKKVIMLAAVVSVMPPLISLIAAYAPFSPIHYAVVFLLLGIADSGISMGYLNYLLEILPEKGRLLSIGAMHSMIAPTVFFSALGGLLSQVFSLRLLFLIVAVTTSISVYISIKLNEPRLKRVIAVSNPD